MGKSSSQTIGYWYYVAYHAGLGIGPIDAFLEFRGGDKTAWAGNLTASGTIHINAPNLWGGEKDQGGIAGDVDVLFGEATQVPNTYLKQAFGNQVPAWRGLATLVFKGGKFGAMNPYPQKPAYKIKRIVKGWDNDACWYPERCAVPIAGTADIQTWSDFSQGFETNAPTMFQIVDGGAIANTTLNATNGDYWRTPLNASNVSSVYFEFKVLTASPGDPVLLGLADASGALIFSFCPRMEDAIDLAQRPGVSYLNDQVPIYASALAVGTLYSFEATLDRAAGSLAYVLKQGGTVLSSGTLPMFNSNEPAYLGIYRSGNRGLSSVAECNLATVTFAGGGSMNPAHILYYARTQQDMGREPAASMHDASFRAAADWYYFQGFGLCTEYDPANESLDDFVARIEKVAGCSMSRSPVDGLWYLDVANGVYDIDSLPVLTDEDILDYSETPGLQDSAPNSKSVEFFDPQKKETVTTAPVQAMALIDAFGTIHDQVSYPEVPSNDLALRLAERDLRADVTPKRAFELSTTRRTYAWRVDTYFRLQCPKRGIADMVCILAEKSSGTLKSGAIKITASQDVYSLSTATFVNAEHGVDTRPSQIPVPIAQQSAFEAPYIEVCATLSRADLAALPADVGYLMAVAADPAASRDFTVMVSTGGDYAETARGDWCATAVMETSGFNDTAFTLAMMVGVANVAVGMPALWGSEIVRIDAIDATTGAVTLGRACADTVPVEHAAGERIWFYSTAAAADTTEYTDGETVHAKLLTNTGSQQLDIGAATDLPMTFASRAARPYPPGQLRINDQVAPTSVTGAIDVTGVHRDRVQQADQLVDSEMAAVGPEPGTTYTVRYYLNNTLVHTDAGLAAPNSTYTPSGAGVMRVEVESVRDDLASYQMHVREFTVGQPLLDESGALITTEDDQLIIMG